MSKQEPVAFLVERHSFRVSPHGQDAEGHDWLEVTNDGEAGSFAVYTADYAESLRQQRDELLTSLESIRDVLEFHEGSAKPLHEGAHPSVIINGDDHALMLADARAAIAKAKEQDA
jgi:hypothetical protein